MLILANSSQARYLWIMNGSQRDDRLYDAANRRNRDPILNVLERFLPETGTVLEVASGTGEHGIYLAPKFPGLTWQPSDPNLEMRKSILAWIQAEGPMMAPPLDLDARADTWPIESAAAIVCINMIHISPWDACLGLMAGAGRILEEGGILYLYGPYKIKNRHYAESNAAFDKSLQSQNPDWGVRDIDDVVRAAGEHGLKFRQSVEMPANNLSVMFVKEHPNNT